VSIAKDGKDLPASSRSPAHIALSSQPGLATLFLNHAGLIENCSSACEAVFGYPRRELRGRHVSLLLPKLEGIELVNDGRINSRLRFLCRCAVPFLARRRDGTRFNSEVFLNYLNGKAQRVQILVRDLGVGAT
jgi:PAS domain S-box-containing protein